MGKLEHLKQIGERFKKPFGKHQSRIRLAVTAVLAAASLTSCTGSCTQGAKADYLDGISTDLLEKIKLILMHILMLMKAFGMSIKS